VVDCSIANQLYKRAIQLTNSRYVHQRYSTRSVSLLTLDHLGEGRDDMSDRVIAAHVIDRELTEVHCLVKVTDCFHKLQLGHDRVLESQLEHVVLTLFDLASARRTNLFVLEVFKNSSTTRLKIVALLIPIGVLTVAEDIYRGDVSGNIALNSLEFERKCMVLVDDLLLSLTLLRAQPEHTFDLELFNRALYRRELLGELSLGFNHAIKVKSFFLQLFFLERIEGDGVLDEHFLNRSLLNILLPELALHIFEELS